MRRYIGAKTRAEFVADEMTIDAVVRTLEIVSAASRRLLAEFREKYQDVPWQQIAGAGNVYRHDYEKVRPELMYATATREVESLLGVLHVEFPTEGYQ